MRCVLLPFVLGLLCACEPLVEDFVDHFPIIEGQKRAEEIVAKTFTNHGYGTPIPTAVMFYADECLPKPWSFDYPDCDPSVHACRCLNGRALYLVWGCVAAVRWRGTVISDTAFAHELGWHCYNFDAFHSLGLDWLVDETNLRLRDEGL